MKRWSVNLISMKRIISLLIVIVLITAIMPISLADSFSDVPVNKWYSAPITYCRELGIVSGYSNGTFKPNNNITRAEFCVMLNKVAEQLDLKSSTITTDSECKTYEKQYSDYKTGKWYSIPIANCIKNGFISGTSKTTLSLNDFILRQDVAVMIDKMFGWTFKPETHQGGLCTNETYTDSKGISRIRYWVTAMYRFIDLGIYQGDNSQLKRIGDSRYKNNKPITRAEMCTVFKFILENQNWIDARENVYEKWDFIATFDRYYFIKKDQIPLYQDWARNKRPDDKLSYQSITKKVKIDSVTIDVLDFDDYTPSSTQMPDLIGLPLEEAKKELEKSNLRFNEDITYTPNTGYASGTVVSTAPNSGVWISKNSMVYLEVAA